MAKQRACKVCKTIFEGSEKCPKCDSKEYAENFKGRVVLMNPEKSEIGKKLKLKEKGNFAIKTR